MRNESLLLTIIQMILIVGIAGANVGCRAVAPAVPEIPGEATSQPAQTGQALPVEQVEQVLALEKMRGHLAVSKALWDAGDYARAGQHAAHPMGEEYGRVAAALNGTDQSTQLKEALGAYSTLAPAGGDAAELETAYTTADEAVAAAEQAVAGTTGETAGFRAALVRGLLTGVAAEYAEAVHDGEVVNAEEYQDAFGFLTRAETHYTAIVDAVQAESPDKRGEIEDAFAQLETAFAEPMPPAEPADPAVVADAADLIGAELGNVFGLPAATETPAEQLAQVRETVEEAVAAYERGDTDQAYERAVSAYLDGFEHLEGDLLQQDRELVETLEQQFKEFRDGIKAGHSADEVATIADEINAKLDEAETLLK